VVSQENVAHYAKDHEVKGKFFNLDHINGPTVTRTGNPGIFKLSSGKILRKTKMVVPM
jgi:hypothetical protein